MTFSHWQRPHSFSVPGISTDVLIIGGGFVGLSTAFWISELNPGLKITILERRQCGEGASGRNAGFLTKGSANFYRELQKKWGVEKAKKILEYAESSLQLLNQHVLRSSPELKAERSASLTLVKRAQSADEWQGDFSAADFGFQWKDSRELAPALQSSFSGGLEHGSAEYKVHPIQMLASIRKNLEARKVQIIENVSGFKLIPEGCLTELHTIKCKQVVLALNGYLPEFHPKFAELITPRRAQMLAVEFEGTLEAPHLHYDPENLVYWRKAADNVVLIGGKRILDVQGEVGDFDRLSPIIQDGLENYLSDVLGLKYKILHRWAGTMGFTSSELPLLQKVVAPLDAYVVGGFSGHGMGLGFKAGFETASLVTGNLSHSLFSEFAQTSIEL